VNPKSSGPPSDSDLSSARVAVLSPQYRVSRSSRPDDASTTATAGSHQPATQESDPPMTGPVPVVAMTR
jgi:hypothetical protein